MSYLHVPAAFGNDAVIYGPLLEPTNNMQRENHRNAIETAAEYASEPNRRRFLSDAFNTHVGHNLAVSRRRFMPFSIVNSRADVIRPYAPWQIYEYLVAVNDSGSVGCKWSMLLLVGCRDRYDEGDLRKALLALRKFRLNAVHPADMLALDTAIAECLYEIDSARARQRLRREPR